MDQTAERMTTETAYWSTAATVTSSETARRATPAPSARRRSNTIPLSGSPSYGMDQKTTTCIQPLGSESGMFLCQIAI